MLCDGGERKRVVMMVGGSWRMEGGGRARERQRKGREKARAEGWKKKFTGRDWGDEYF